MYEHRDASERLMFDFDEIDSVQYSSITKSVAKQFRLESVAELVIGLDEMFQDYQHNEKIVGLEWDNWSGYMVVAKIKSAEDLARDIASFIESHHF